MCIVVGDGMDLEVELELIIFIETNIYALKKYVWINGQKRALNISAK
jgi:hypothetical protein